MFVKFTENNKLSGEYLIEIKTFQEKFVAAGERNAHSKRPN